jgi:uncharacterized protein (TIGR03000 family)
VDGGSHHASMSLADEAPVTLVVTLPADARLIVDDKPTVSTSDVRVFTTPPLPVGKDFHYTLRAEVNRDGRTQSVTQEVTVRGGEEARVTLDVPAMMVAAE